MRFLLPALFLAAAAVAVPDPAHAQIEGKSMSYGRIRCDSFGPESTCPIDTSRGVVLVREFSRNRCIEGRTWGWDPFRIWVRDGCQAEFEIGGGGGPGGGSGREVICESRNNRIEYCRADTRGGVRLLEQLSRSQCIRDRTWGFDRHSIWVRDGCRARFELGGVGGGWQPPPPPPPQAGLTFRCESQRGRREYCPVAMGDGFPVLVRNLSNTRCDLERNWGWDRGGVWVDDGCRGEFRIEFGGNPGGNWGGQGGSQQSQIIRCESRDGRMHFCNANTANAFIRITRQLSNAPCQEGYSFGWDHTGIWVNHGCRGEFEIRSRF